MFIIDNFKEISNDIDKEVDEGPMISSNVIDCDPDEVKIGMPVEVVFEDITDEFTLPKFRLVR
ncbi:Zn-ribbon domain-containing OB-fold protein [Thermodesulfobacteriota bacterium]